MQDARLSMIAIAQRPFELVHTTADGNSYEIVQRCGTVRFRVLIGTYSTTLVDLGGNPIASSLGEPGEMFVHRLLHIINQEPEPWLELLEERARAAREARSIRDRARTEVNELYAALARTEERLLSETLLPADLPTSR